MLYQTTNPHGGDVYRHAVRLDFSANTNPLGTPPAVVAAAQSALSSVSRYPDPCCKALTAAIAAFEGVPETYILCGNGAAELIYSVCGGLRPKRAAETAPTFLEYGLALEQASCRVERYTLRQENDFTVDEGILAFLREKKPEVLFLCNPNNPTGRRIAPDLLLRILELCSKIDTRLVVDECFLDLTEGGVSLKPLLAENPHLLLLKAFTKSYGMAGLRLGYCLCSDGEWLQAMSRTVPPWNVSLPAQSAGIAALGETDFLQRAKAIIAAERPWMKAELERLGCWVCPSDANYLLFRAKAGLDDELRQQGIALRSCANYHGLGEGWYRTAVRRHEENQMLLDALARLV